MHINTLLQACKQLFPHCKYWLKHTTIKDKMEQNNSWGNHSLCSNYTAYSALLLSVVMSGKSLDGFCCWFYQYSDLRTRKNWPRRSCDRCTRRRKVEKQVPLKCDICVHLCLICFMRYLWQMKAKRATFTAPWDEKVPFFQTLHRKQTITFLTAFIYSMIEQCRQTRAGRLIN